MKKYQYILNNLDCANCAAKIESKVSSYSEFNEVIVNFNTQKLTVKTDIMFPKEKIDKIIKSIEPNVEVLENNLTVSNNNDFKLQILRFVIGLVFAIIGFFVKISPVINEIIIITAYAILLFRTVKNAFKLILKNKVIDENFLISISCIGAYLVGEHMEGLMVIILYEIGKILEDRAVNKTRKSITDLMDIQPEYANLKSGKEYIKVDPKSVKIGDIVMVKQGERIPLDGIIVNGNTKLDTAALTGESKLTFVKAGDEVLSGSINVNSIIEIEVVNIYENSTVNKILELVENATDKKAKTETMVSKIAKIYTPVVLILAILIAVFMPLIVNVSYSQSIYRSLIFLVISCPCAIAISVPLSYFSGIGRASKSGILIKGSDYLDNIKNINEIIFDKTGTITTGNFNISKIVILDKNYCEEQLLDYIAKGEKFSNHPISRAILNKVKSKVDISNVQDYTEVSGSGLQYKLDGKLIKIGNDKFIKFNGKLEDGTSIFLSIEDKIVGFIVIKDEIKESAKIAISKLNSMNILTRMFTGDNQKIAKQVAKTINIKEVKSQMLPADKYVELEKILNSYKGTGKKVAFVGDGINDSPVLALSDIGISMGGVGAQSAIEASDVVIMTDDLERIIEGIKISKFTSNIIKQNLIFAIGTKVLILILSTFGLAGMWQAIFADVGVTLITILNTLRILNLKK